MKTVTALNTVSGQVGVVPADYLTHPVLGLNLVEVDPGTKSYEASKYKPMTAAEYRADHVEKAPAKSKRQHAAVEDEQEKAKPIQPTTSVSEIQ